MDGGACGLRGFGEFRRIVIEICERVVLDRGGGRARGFEFWIVRHHLAAPALQQPGRAVEGDLQLRPPEGGLGLGLEIRGRRMAVAAVGAHIGVSSVMPASTSAT